MGYLNISNTTENTKGQINELSDEEVLVRCAAAPAEFAVLVDRYHDAFVRKANSILHDVEATHDVVQDTFTKIYMNAKKFKGGDGSNARAWMYRILTNTCFTHYQKIKKERGRTVFVDQELLEQTAVGDSRESIESSFAEKELLLLIGQLPRKFSRLIRMHYLDGLAHKEIAEEEDMSISAVKTRIHRGKKELKKIAINAHALN